MQLSSFCNIILLEVKQGRRAESTLSVVPQLPIIQTEGSFLSFPFPFASLLVSGLLLLFFLPQFDKDNRTRCSCCSSWSGENVVIFSVPVTFWTLILAVNGSRQKGKKYNRLSRNNVNKCAVDCCVRGSETCLFTLGYLVQSHFIRKRHVTMVYKSIKRRGVTHYYDLFAKKGDILVYFPLRKPQKPHKCTLLAFLVNQGTHTPPPPARPPP